MISMYPEEVTTGTAAVRPDGCRRHVAEYGSTRKARRREVFSSTRIFSVDVISRRSATPTLGSIGAAREAACHRHRRWVRPLPRRQRCSARWESRREFFSRWTRTSARRSQTLLGGSTNAIVLEFGPGRQARTHARSLRDGVRAFTSVSCAPDLVQGIADRRPRPRRAASSRCRPPSTRRSPPDAMKGRYVRSGQHGVQGRRRTRRGRPSRVRIEKSAHGPARSGTRRGHLRG